jgi:hypothetical protein
MDRLAGSLTHTEREGVADIGTEQLAAVGVFGCNVRTALLGLQEATKSASRRPEVCSIFRASDLGVALFSKSSLGFTLISAQSLLMCDLTCACAERDARYRARDGEAR